MKTTAKALSFQEKWNTITGGKCEPLTNQTTPLRMNHEEVTPPSHVWDRISAALDEQDNQKQQQKRKQLLVLVAKIGLAVLTLSVALYFIF